MTTLKQLYSLQEVDLNLDGVNDQIAEVERELAGRLSLDKIEESLEKSRDRLQEIQSAHRQLQLETESQRERASHLETQLYGGDVENPRDLEALQLETNNVRHTLEQMDVRLLELSLQAEDARSQISAQEQQLTDTQSAWEIRQAQLWEQLEELTDRQEALQKDRNNLAAGVDPMGLNRYEGLRRNKGGLAVSKVMRGLCQACRMSLPSQQLQRVRNGRQVVLCNNCGRILLPG
jgi:predicted  nucleic acid-binding Zn-ribbon protein